MKALRVILGTGSLLACFPAFANPILFIPFNELKFTGNDWTIEMLTDGFIGTLDGRSLRSNSGTAFFKNGIHLPSGYLLVTQDSLLSPLNINPLGDSLTFNIPGGSLTFGNSPSAVVPSPGESQSISYGGRGYYYLDNSPTLGQHNDSANAMGTVQGLIADSLGRPIPDVRVFSYEWPASAYTDSSGRFEVRDYAHRCQMNLTHSQCSPKSVTVQIWPESTVSVAIVMHRVDAVNEDQHAQSGYRLDQNYPNPFNPVTTFSFTIPRLSLVTLKVYDVFGKEVAALVNEVRTAGSNKALWDASDVASGVYFYRLSAGGTVLTRRMVLIR